MNYMYAKWKTDSDLQSIREKLVVCRFVTDQKKHV